MTLHSRLFMCRSRASSCVMFQLLDGILTSMLSKPPRFNLSRSDIL